MADSREGSGYMRMTIGGLLFAVALLAPIYVWGVQPRLQRVRVASNETAAIGLMRLIPSTQLAFQKKAGVDADGDGVGEMATLPQLALGSGKLHPVQGSHVLERAGYYFRVHLPAKGTGAETPTDARERRFVAYAWPVRRGLTGNRAFAVDEAALNCFCKGHVYATANDLRLYSGLTTMPAPGAALVAAKGENPANLEGQLVTGVLATDGAMWLGPG